MTEADLEAFVTAAQENHPSMGPGELFNWILHNIPEKVPQKRIRACMARLGYDKIPKPEPGPMFVSQPYVPAPYEEEPVRELKQKVVVGLRPERPETADELREMFDPRD
jgi:hypothetical protein